MQSSVPSVPISHVRRAIALAALFLVPASGCVQPPGDGESAAVAPSVDSARTGALPGGAAAPPPAEVPPPGPLTRDREIFEETMAFARAERLDTLPMGETVARIGRRFVGTPYEPGTLEVPGPERLVVNLRTLDCVTFVETVLAMSRVVHEGTYDFGAFQAELQRIRYRGGVLDGYASRLHYFSEWISDNERTGIVRQLTREVGGERVEEPVRFMSSNARLYPKLSDPEQLGAIRRMEERLSAEPRHFVPQERIAEVAPRIRNGDVIAATSTVEGLDVAHTGFALWVDGRLHLMHAPLVGKSVEISEHPLAERIRGIRGQDGILVARPVDPSP